MRFDEKIGANMLYVYFMHSHIAGVFHIMWDMDNCLHYKVFGRGEKALLFLHGWGGNSSSFAPLVNILKDTYYCICPDFYGHGETPCNAVYDLHDFTLGVGRVLEREGISRASIVAHSFGGRVALDMASDPRVNALVIMDGAGMKPRPSVRKFARTLDYRVKKLIGADTSRCGSPDYKALSPQMKATFVNVVNTRQNGVLGQINKPILLIWGKDDSDTPLYMAHKMHKGISASRLIVLSGGHFCYLDHAFEVAGYIRNFLNGVYYGVDSGGSGRHIGRGDGNARNGVDPACGIQDKPQ